jgi:hypothetical protein
MNLPSIQPTRIFVLFALIFGILFIVVTPPFQVPDEGAHFSRAYQISQFHIIGEKNSIKRED